MFAKVSERQRRFVRRHSSNVKKTELDDHKRLNHLLSFYGGKTLQKQVLQLPLKQIEEFMLNNEEHDR